MRTKQMVLWGVVCLLCMAPLAWALVPAGVAAQSTSRIFPETGKTVSGRFLQYWQDHGGLAQQGLPVSEPIGEVSEVDGRTYTVQYFERAVFEYHPENQPPNDVLLSLIGASIYNQKYSGGAPSQAANIRGETRVFTETGKHLGGIFLDYWNAHGGLAQQGLPISDEFIEPNAADGQYYRVQYFERAVFENHPEISSNAILLSLLGAARYQAKYGSGAVPLAPPYGIPPAVATPTPKPQAPPKDVQAFARYLTQKYGQIGSYRLSIDHTSVHDTATLGHSIIIYLSRDLPLTGGPSRAEAAAWGNAVLADALTNWPDEKFSILLVREYYDWYPDTLYDTACYHIGDLDPNRGWDMYHYSFSIIRIDATPIVSNCVYDL